MVGRSWWDDYWSVVACRTLICRHWRRLITSCSLHSRTGCCLVACCSEMLDSPGSEATWTHHNRPTASCTLPTTTTHTTLDCLKRSVRWDPCNVTGRWIYAAHTDVLVGVSQARHSWVKPWLHVQFIACNYCMQFIACNYCMQFIACNYCNNCTCNHRSVLNSLDSLLANQIPAKGVVTIVCRIEIRKMAEC